MIGLHNYRPSDEKLDYRTKLVLYQLRTLAYSIQQTTDLGLFIPILHILHVYMLVSIT